jgi:hypothetical protein
MYTCSHCQTLAVICRSCDRGNIYCSEECAAKKRRESWRASSKRYQATFAGKVKHAARQERYREAVKEKVTQQGTHVEASVVSLETTTETEAPHLVPDYARLQCTLCGVWCGLFVRQEPWHGGRLYIRKRRTIYDRVKRNRGRDSPVALCGEVAKKHNCDAIENPSFNSRTSALEQWGSSRATQAAKIDS